MCVFFCKYEQRGIRIFFSQHQKQLNTLEFVLKWQTKTKKETFVFINEIKKKNLVIIYNQVKKKQWSSSIIDDDFKTSG